jgi:hypothetical protein
MSTAGTEAPAMQVEELAWSAVGIGAVIGAGLAVLLVGAVGAFLNRRLRSSGR